VVTNGIAVNGTESRFPVFGEVEACHESTQGRGRGIGHHQD
jgi:hypothetical protein